MRKINTKGNTLLLTILVTSLMLFLGIYFLSLSLADRSIAQSHSQALQAYYLAESGLQEAIFRLKNNVLYQTNFENDPSWNVTFTSSNHLINNSSYEVTITNTALAHANVVSTGSIILPDGTATQRVVKTALYKAIGAGGTVNLGEDALITDEEAWFAAANPNIAVGSLHANGDVTVLGGFFPTTLAVADDLKTTGSVITLWNGFLNIGDEIHATNYPPVVAPASLPPISFDNPSDPNSFKSRATVSGTVYTKAQFDSLISSSGSPITFNAPITYVTGDVTFPKDKDVIINGGVLVSDGTITLGNGSAFWCGLLGVGVNFDITINHTPGQASGLIAKGHIEFSYCSNSAVINGLIYASNDVVVLRGDNGFTVNGGIVGRNFGNVSWWTPITINLDNAIVEPALSTLPEFSPVISIEHWEEDY